MTRSASRTGWRISLRRRSLLAASLFLAAAACCQKGQRAAPPGSAAAELRRYTVRGEVVRLPDPAQPQPEIYVRHEPIHDFVDQSGQVVGMGSMVMPFHLGSQVPGPGLAVGDKVEIRFAVGWSPPAFRVESVRELPPATQLHFGPASPPRGERPAAAGGATP